MALLDPTERKVLVISTFVAGVISLFPMEWVSGVSLLVLSAVFYRWDLRISQREEAAERAASPTVEAAKAGDEGAITPSPEAG